MNSKDRINIGVSSGLVDLKAELLRKQSELLNSKSEHKGVQKSISRSKEHKKKLALKNAGVEQRNAADLEEHEKNEKTYDRAKVILEQKAKLYDRMMNAPLNDELHDHPVFANSSVNFLQKAIDNDIGVAATVETNVETKDSIHYQDLLFDEVRDHGVGYYAFSTEDGTRAEQIRDLKKLSEHTKSSQDKVMKDRSQKNTQLQARLRKIINKKRAKLGLPLKESSEEEEDEAKKPKLN